MVSESSNELPQTYDRQAWAGRVRALSVLITFILPLLASAQNTERVPRLCFLTFDPGTLSTTRFDAFFEGLRDFGYRNGQTITIDYLSAEGQADRVPAQAAECVRRKADIIVVTTTPIAEAARSATQTVPIVMCSLADPVGSGLVASLARPGGNIKRCSA